jgi:hypothetical protein
MRRCVVFTPTGKPEHSVADVWYLVAIDFVITMLSLKSLG